MEFAKPLPEYLVKRYQGWKATTYAENKSWYKRLAEDGQHPRAMVISCCDSRVHVTSIFGADQGEFFIHRNIANLVPAYAADGKQHGTSATVEYAVTALKVAVGFPKPLGMMFRIGPMAAGAHPWAPGFFRSS